MNSWKFSRGGKWTKKFYLRKWWTGRVGIITKKTMHHKWINQDLIGGKWTKQVLFEEVDGGWAEAEVFQEWVWEVAVCQKGGSWAWGLPEERVWEVEVCQEWVWEIEVCQKSGSGSLRFTKRGSRSLRFARRVKYAVVVGSMVYPSSYTFPMESVLL